MKAVIPPKLSKAQVDAMTKEIKRQVIENDENFTLENEASILWTLHTVFGFGKEKLHKFYKEHLKLHNEMKENYILNTGETYWLCRYRLKEYGIDIAEWYKEVK